MEFSPKRPLFDKEPHITNWLNNVNGKLLKRKLVFTWCVKEKVSKKVIGRIDLGGFVKKCSCEGIASVYPIIKIATGSMLSDKSNSILIASGIKYIIHVVPMPSSVASIIICVATILASISPLFLSSIFAELDF